MSIIIKMEEIPEEKIKVEGTISLVDKDARTFLSILDAKITTINERTKNHTLQIRELAKGVKELKK